jgi:uncharacterized coiled-coil protein SlyX
MNSKAPIKLLPVLRRPRREWQIPLFETPANRKAREEKEARSRAFSAGTTPYGREIFRRILDLAWRLVEQNKSFEEASKQVVEQLGTFPEVHSEFVLLLGRMLEEERQDGEPVQLEGTSPWGWAMQLVLRARMGQKFNRELAGEDSTNNESDGIDPA